jgi:CDP-glucose 4,6-dehydratase
MEGLAVTVDGLRCWQGRRVLVTGHTGFKGSWLVLLLQRLGAHVTGIALPPEPGPSMFAALAPWPGLDHHEIDLADRAALAAALRASRPEVVFHLAAQAIVGRSHREPVLTFATNVGGTVHLLEALRGLAGTAAAVIVTSDKVYRNDGSGRPFVESDPLGGSDPYSASKAAAELVVSSWRASFAAEMPALATARAGNVIGGGDFGEDRLLPDIVRVQAAGTALMLRHPGATRPWQFVLDVLEGYLRLAQALVENPASAPTAVNFGPAPPQGLTVRELVAQYEQISGTHVPLQLPVAPVIAEAPRLSLDASLAAAALHWQCRTPLPAALRQTADWYRHWRRGEDLRRASLAAIDEAFGA